MTEHKTVGQLIRERRLEKGWSQTELGQRVGRSQRYVSGLETGARRATRDAALAPLADALDIPYDELLVAAGLVHTRNAALQLRRLSDDLNADERTRLEEAHAKLDSFLVQLEPSDLAVVVSVAEALARK